MQQRTEEIDLSNIEESHLPLGYKKIQLERIPPKNIENKLMFYNRKYKFNSTVALGAEKPISKIIKFK